MNHFSAALVICIGAFAIHSAYADLKEVECKGKKYAVAEEHQANIKECLAKTGIASMKDLNGQNAGCFSRCSMIKKGLIDDSGKPHKEKIMNMIEDHIPDPIRGEWKTAIENCLDTEGSKIDISDDKTCASFLPLSMCFHQAFMKICM